MFHWNNQLIISLVEENIDLEAAATQTKEGLSRAKR
jgi:hypothetical protein